MAKIDTGGRGLIQFDNIADRFQPAQTAEVRNLYQWTMQFGLTAEATGGAIGNALGSTASSINSNVTFYVRTTDLPRVTVETQTINQYNIRRNVNTHISYEPLTMTFYDTQDNAFQKYLQAYMAFKSKNWDNAPNVRAPFQLGSGYVPEFGMRSPKMGFGQGGIIDGINFGDFSPTSTLNDNFASHIVINKVMYAASKAATDQSTPIDVTQQITLYNPKIVDISQDQLDYSNGGAPLTWTVTWRYESYAYNSPETTSLTAVGGVVGDVARGVQEAGRTVGRAIEDIVRRFP